MMKFVMDNNILNFTESSYTNKVIKSMVEQNHNIWLNIEQIMQLTNIDLQHMLISIDDGDGKYNEGAFMLYLKSLCNVIICPIFTTTWIMNEKSFQIITDTKHVEVIIGG
eukprot:131150_1